jgi:hypothetical protein|tara:strand:+ start:28 stop:576 length:549 start_codon:yes stop_codon:yes gene_type:complete
MVTSKIQGKTMNQEEIEYGDIMALRFSETCGSDKVYEHQYGYAYCIIEKKLTDNVHIEWDKPTRLAKMVRVDHKSTNNIVCELPIRDLEHLQGLISIFCVESEESKPEESKCEVQSPTKKYHYAKNKRGALIEWCHVLDNGVKIGSSNCITCTNCTKSNSKLNRPWIKCSRIVEAIGNNIIS